MGWSQSPVGSRTHPESHGQKALCSDTAQTSCRCVHGVGIQTLWQKLSTQASSHLHLLSLLHQPGGIVVCLVVSSVVVVMDVVVGVIVVIVEGVVDVVEVVVTGASKQWALPVLQPLQSRNGSISCDSRKHLWLSAMWV